MFKKILQKPTLFTASYCVCLNKNKHESQLKKLNSMFWCSFLYVTTESCDRWEMSSEETTYKLHVNNFAKDEQYLKASKNQTKAQ